MTDLHQAPGAFIEELMLKEHIERALYDEAALLDARRYGDWLDTLTDDVIYWIPIRSTRAADDVEHEFTGEDEGALVYDDRTALAVRVEKLRNGFAYYEDPPSRTRHCLTNIRILEHAGDEVTVSSNIVLYTSRLESDEDRFVGRRVDRLRLVDGRWKLARREVYLDHTVLPGKNIGTFF
jgi:biphenyl 2,3-dioxygenase subunit beta